MATFPQSCFETKYKPEDDTNKIRTIGLELEVVVDNQMCPLHKHNRENLTEGIENDDDYYDDEEQDEIAVGMMNYLIEKKIPFANVGLDGDDIELVTHPDSMSYYLEGGSDRFKQCMQFLKKNCIAGKYAENSGTHVNVGKLPNEDENYVMDNAYWICMNFAIQLQKIAGRVTHWARFENYNNDSKIIKIPLNKTFVGKNASIQSIQKPNTVATSCKYGSKSRFLVNKSYTYEFRLFKSTIDRLEALAWVELCNNIIELAAGKKPVSEITFIDLIKGEYIFKYVNQLSQARKITEEEMNATVANTLIFKCYDTQQNIIL